MVVITIRQCKKTLSPHFNIVIPTSRSRMIIICVCVNRTVVQSGVTSESNDESNGFGWCRNRMIQLVWMVVMMLKVIFIETSNKSNAESNEFCWCRNGKIFKLVWMIMMMLIVVLIETSERSAESFVGAELGWSQTTSWYRGCWYDMVAADMISWMHKDKCDIDNVSIIDPN